MRTQHMCTGIIHVEVIMRSGMAYHVTNLWFWWFYVSHILQMWVIFGVFTTCSVLCL